jgi:hypothetical protein
MLPPTCLSQVENVEFNASWGALNIAIVYLLIYRVGNYDAKKRQAYIHSCNWRFINGFDVGT